MTKFLKLFAVILLICSCSKAPKLTQITIETEDGDITYNVEVASTIEELETGLMNRDTLAADSGMLFDLSNVQSDVTAMWMKDTKLPLDMLFLTKEGVIYYIKENAQPYSQDLIIAPVPAAAVIELNGGDIAKNKIKIGYRVKHNLFKMREDIPEKAEPEEEAPETVETEETPQAND